MKRVLVLGAGLVAGPMIRYLLGKDIQVTVASRTVEKAERLVGGHPGGTALAFDIEKDENLDELVREHDVTVSLLPYIHHVTVAKACLRAKKHMVTTSYISEEMKGLDAEGKENNVILLNELGLDPGIDHMEAMRIIEEAHDEGGDVKSFLSYCGGLPAPEANDNPLGYKFSWSPRGVLLAGRNNARFLKDGKIVNVESKDLFTTTEDVSVPELGHFQGYPNRDSVPYAELYGIPETDTMFRGTLRNRGWCPTMKKLGDLGMLDLEKMEMPEGSTWADLTRRLLGGDEGDLKELLARKLGIETDSQVMEALEWIGLLSDRPLPSLNDSPLDILAKEIEPRMRYKEGERDMIVLQHEFIVEYPEGKKEKITSYLIDFGIPGGDSAMARTVSLPAAIGVTLILDGKVEGRGVMGPMTKDIYEPALAELKELGISFKTIVEEA